jgi:hypothetical protein
MTAKGEFWPALPFDAWADTAETLHRWAQIVGKVRLACTPWVNHSWHVALYVSTQGLTTSLMHWKGIDFEIEFDFQRDLLAIETAEGDGGEVPLEPQTVAEFYDRLMAELARLGIHVEISPRPCEVEDATPFPEDTVHSAYDGTCVRHFWTALLRTHAVFSEFRSRFTGKSSPVHFFWGSFDLALTRFSGRPAPPHPGGAPNLADWVMREAYSHEVASCGFWPGNRQYPHPVYYSYAYPEPAGFSHAPVRPDGARYDEQLREFVLPYETVRSSEAPDEMLLSFLQSTYEAAAKAGSWDRALLERERHPRDLFR